MSPKRVVGVEISSSVLERFADQRMTKGRSAMPACRTARSLAITGLKFKVPPFPSGNEVVYPLVVLFMVMMRMRRRDLEGAGLEPSTNQDLLEIIQRSIGIDDAVGIINQHPLAIR